MGGGYGQISSKGAFGDPRLVKVVFIERDWPIHCLLLLSNGFPETLDPSLPTYVHTHACKLAFNACLKPLSEILLIYVYRKSV